MKLRPALLTIALGIVAGGAVAAPPPADVVIERVNVLPLTSIGAALRDVNVVIRDGRIVSIESAAGPRQHAAQRVDGSGQWLLPAFADMHVHFENPRLLRLWLNDPRIPDDAVDLADLAAPYVANGVLQIANMSAMSESIGQRREIESGRVLGPHMALGAMIDGSPPEWPPGMTRVAATAGDGRQAVRDAEAEGYDFIKVYNRLDLPTYSAIVDEARVQGMRVVGHLIARGQGITDRLFQPGFGMVAHLQEYSQQTADLTDAQIQRFAAMTKRNGTWVVTTLRADQNIARVLRDEDALSDWPQHQHVHPLTYRYWMDRNPLLSDRSAERVARFERIAADSARLLRAFVAADVPVVAGTDLPLPLQAPGFALHDELQAMVDAGMPPERVLQSATRLPATWLGMDHDRGTVEVGKRADLVLLAADPRADIANTRRITAVFVAGRPLIGHLLLRSMNKSRLNAGGAESIVGARRAATTGALTRWRMTFDCDVAIAGAGHNGLACAAALARSGMKVLVAERSAWVGGATATREVTLPGFHHDLYGSSHVWIHANAHFKALEPELRQHGLEYLWANEGITGHPGTDGPGIIVYKDVDRTCESIARFSAKDAQRYREIYEGFVDIKDGFVKAMYSPPAPPSFLPAAMERSTRGLRMLRDYQLSARAFVAENFEHPQVQAFILGWALAPQITPEQEAIGQSFYIMIPGIHVYGQAIPRGGSQALAQALASYVRSKGGEIVLSSAVTELTVKDSSVRGLKLADGSEVRASKAVVSSLDPHQTFLKLLDPAALPADFLKLARGYSFGNIGVFRSHYALNEAPVFKEGAQMSRTPFQRIFGSVADTEQHYADIASGVAPRDPFIWSACWTLMDPSRAPAGKHTLILDTFVPSKLRDGTSWDSYQRTFADRLMEKFRRYTTNMGPDNILGEYIDTPESIEQANPCLVGGATTGGERTLAQSGFFRPFPGYSQYRSPVRGLYLTGASCHPGGGITAMGMVTAREILRDQAQR